MADSDITALTELTNPVAGDWLVIDDTSDSGTTKKLDFGVVTGGVISPEQYGCVGDNIADDTTNLQAAIDAAIANNLTLKGTGAYRVTSTIEIFGGTSVFEIDLASGYSFGGSTGIIWDGLANNAIVEMGVIQRSRISLVVNNGVNDLAGMTGILIHNPDASGTSMNHNYFPYIGVMGCDIAMQWGDTTGDGYASNFDDNSFEFVQFYDCKNGLLIDSVAQDNNVIEYFHSGNAPSIVTRTREYAIRALANGNGFRVINGFCRADNTVADNAVIDIRSHSFSCDRMGMEFGTFDDVLPLSISNNQGRDQSIIRNFALGDEGKNSNGLSMSLRYRGGMLVEGCNLPGAVAHDRPLTAINNIFSDTAYSGTHDGANNAATLSDSTASFTVDSLIGLTIENTTDGSEATITDNDATTITGTLSGGTDNDWDTNDEYRIGGGVMLAGGSHDGADNASILVDSSQSWMADSLIGQIIRNVTDGSEGYITDNAATTITATLSGGTDDDWDIGDVYSVTGTGFLGGRGNLVEVNTSRREASEADITIPRPVLHGVYKQKVAGIYAGNIFASTVFGTISIANLNADRPLVNPTADSVLDRWTEITYVCIADGTQRRVTPQSAFHLASGAAFFDVAANTTTIIKFIYDGTNWLESSRVEGIAP